MDMLNFKKLFFHIYFDEKMMTKQIKTDKVKYLTLLNWR